MREGLCFRYGNDGRAPLHCPPSRGIARRASSVDGASGSKLVDKADGLMWFNLYKDALTCHKLEPQAPPPDEVCSSRRRHAALGYVSPRQFEDRDARRARSNRQPEPCPPRGAHSSSLPSVLTNFPLENRRNFETLAYDNWFRGQLAGLCCKRAT
jgi:hypothetical protein